MTARIPSHPARSITSKIRPTPKLANSQAVSPSPTRAPTTAPSLIRALDAEDVRLLPVTVDVRRERGVLVREVTRPVIAVAGQVVGDVQDAPGRIRQVRLRGVRHEAVEEDDIPGSRRHRPQVQPLLLERLPLLADEPLTVAAGDDLQTAVFQRGRIECHHGSDEQGRINGTTGLL